MPRSRNKSQYSNARAIVIDNGGYTAKMGFAGDHNPLLEIGNYTARPKKEVQVLVGDDITSVPNKSQLVFQSPFERGYLTDPEALIAVWNRAFGPNHLDIDPAVHPLLVTEKILGPETICNTFDQIIFEQFGFPSCFRTGASVLSGIDYYVNKLNVLPPPCFMVVDSGYSNTMATPIAQFAPIYRATKRLDIGGKFLTNFLKQITSYRHWNMMDETFVMDEAKQKLCYVSLNYEVDLKECGFRRKDNKIWRNYALPDHNNVLSGIVYGQDEARPAEHQNLQTLFVNNERISVPELLFRPIDIGLNQAGVPELIHQAISKCDETTASLLYGNIILTGGNTNFPNYKERIVQELRPMVPSHMKLNVDCVDDPNVAAFRGGSMLALQPFFPEIAVTKAQYEEHGSNICRQKFHCELAGIDENSPLECM